MKIDKPRAIFIVVTLVLPLAIIAPLSASPKYALASTIWSKSSLHFSSAKARGLGIFWWQLDIVHWIDNLRSNTPKFSHQGCIVLRPGNGTMYDTRRSLACFSQEMD